MVKSTKKQPQIKPKRGRKFKSIENLKEDIKSKCLSIKSIIESGNLKALKELEPLFSKAMADEMGVNHTRFGEKLRNPIKFSVYDIYRFAYYVDADPIKLSMQINNEITADKNLLKGLDSFKSISDIKQYNSPKK
jgi:hypothetical protein